MTKHQSQTSKSNIELFIYIIVYITEFEAVIFLCFLVTTGLQHARMSTLQLRSNIMIKHQSQTSTCSPISSSILPSSTMSSSAVSGYRMTATCTCLCMLVHVPCMYTLTAYRNGHTYKPTIPIQHLVLVATASSEWRAFHHHLSILTW